MFPGHVEETFKKIEQCKFSKNVYFTSFPNHYRNLLTCKQQILHKVMCKALQKSNLQFQAGI